MDQKSPEAFRTISEVAQWLDTPAHVLRFWESRFPQVKPVKRAGGRRYYRPSDMALLGGIKKLLHEDGMTIRGVQKILKTQGVRHVAAMSPDFEEGTAAELEAEDDAVEAPAPEPERPDPSAAAPIAPEGAAAPEPATTAAEPEQAATPEPEPEPVMPEAEPARPAPLRLVPDPVSDAAPDDAHDEDANAAEPETTAPQDRQPQFSFDAPEAPQTAPQRPPEPAAPAAEGAEEHRRLDLSAFAEVPAKEDPKFDGPDGPFPLSDPRAVRSRLAAEPARAAALYERLVALAGRMPAARQ